MAEGADSGACGSAGTSGGPGGTSGGALRRAWGAQWPFLLAVGAVIALYAVVNALSVAQERAGHVAPWEPWVWEATSALAMAALVPVIAMLAHRLRPPRVPRPLAAAAHAVAAVAVGLAHVGMMVPLRRVAYAAHGWAYQFAFDVPTLGYELRKDVRTYVLIALGYALWRRLRSPTPAPITAPVRQPTPAAPFRLTVRDGARTHFLAADAIDWAEAAGNYVELHAQGGAILHRTSLAALEAELGAHGFARIHRSRLVRLAAVRSLETTASGDFEVTLADGTTIGGSRRFRTALADHTKL